MAGGRPAKCTGTLSWMTLGSHRKNQESDGAGFALGKEVSGCSGAGEQWTDGEI